MLQILFLFLQFLVFTHNGLRVGAYPEDCAYALLWGGLNLLNSKI